MFKQNKLNLCKRICLEFLKNYDINILYHLGKLNVVVDALSRLSMNSVAHIEDEKKKLVHIVHRLARLSVHLGHFDEDGVIVQNGSKCHALGGYYLNDRHSETIVSPQANHLAQLLIHQ